MPALNHRCFSARNPLAKALALTACIFIMCALLLRSDTIDVRKAIAKSAASAKEAISSQRPLGNYYDGGLGADWSAPVEQDSSQPALSPPSTTSNSSHDMTCDYDMGRLRKWQEKYKMQEVFEYTKRYVQVERKDIPRKSITRLEQKFLPEQAKVVDINKQYQAETCPEPLVAPVPRSPFPATAKASDFMFGVSTTYKRFTDPKTSPVNEWTYWLTDGNGTSNGGKLILMLLDASDADLEDADAQLRKEGIDVDVYKSDATLEMAVRYLTLVPTLYNHPERKNKKWLVTCDDDTFFPSFHALAERFEQYNHEAPMYIGTLSEDINNVARHGTQAFGGAGVFLSVPMAKVVAEKYDSCRTQEKIRQSNSGWGPQGDILLRKCIYENSNTKLTTLWDLWQIDLYGDPSGFYESGIKPLSLHHYRGGGWHIAHPWHYTKVAHVCGEDCTLQRFQTADNFIISNSFSVAYYPRGIDFDLNQFERTFSPAPQDKGWNLDYMLGPQRDSLHRTGRKISWDLQEATLNDDGTVSQIYVRKHDDWRWKMPDGSAMSTLDGLVELIWLPEGKPE
ncbi:glycosyltransferase family 31 protein [Lasiosphaeria miniovina]|uniref:Glycosyltransferase family 31 protein n=1 Tax=Lasiosphaeria miniovina TaxID=1954250 RepID=A0AA40DTA5_9PEZI|nr:glycosyltransferase family 31 protein [Lasiosphaeria miniovina]KAK0712552.1 glycosyltransferase family 31 protein [Lasiosphaeria miniovina]